jgi:carbamate kinase
MTPQERDRKWLLARLRTIRAGILLVVAQVDEIGIDLAGGIITPEQAALDITALEQLPVYFAAHIFSPGEMSEAA